MMWRRIGSGPIVTIGFGRNSVISFNRVPRPPHRIKTGISGIFNGASLASAWPLLPSAAGFVTKPPTSQGWQPTVALVVNSAGTGAERSPAARDPLRRTARHAPRAGIAKGPTAGEKEALPYAKRG